MLEDFVIDKRDLAAKIGAAEGDRYRAQFELD